MTERKSNGCLTGLMMGFELLALAAFFALLIFKVAKVAEITWFVVFLPLIIGAGTPVVLFGIAVLIVVLVRVFKGMSEANDND